MGLADLIAAAEAGTRRLPDKHFDSKEQLVEESVSLAIESMVSRPWDAPCRLREVTGASTR